MSNPTENGATAASGGSPARCGAAIFGVGPFELQGGRFVALDVAEDLRKNPLPLLKNPKNGAVDQEQVPVPAGALGLDRREGTGGVVFSTLTPYTTLRPDIFNPLINAFEAATRAFPRRKPIPPYDLCFEASAFDTTPTGFGVANIDLMLDDGRNWTLPGASSLVLLDPLTACFAFRNMAVSEYAAVADPPAVIVGAYKMESTLLLFDVEKGTFGFSGLLSGRMTTCGNFNFAMGSS